MKHLIRFKLKSNDFSKISEKKKANSIIVIKMLIYIVCQKVTFSKNESKVVFQIRAIMD